MKHRIEIKELCQSSNISKEHAELIVKEIQDVFNINNIHALIFEVVLSFEGITSISLESSSIIRNYIFDNNLEKSIYLINMTPYVRQVFFHNYRTSKETNEMNNTNQKEISKFGKWFLDIMNNQGGAKALIIFGLSALALFLGPYFMQTFILMCSDMNTVSKVVVVFGFLCVATALFFLVKMLIFISKKTDLFK